MGCKALRIGLALFLVGCMLFLALILLESQTQAQEGSIRYVAPGSDCGEKIPCYDHLQDAVDAANSGDIIKVATGTYTGVSAREGVTQVVYLSKTVTIRGGYTTTNWTTSDPNANATTLDAQGQGRVLYITGSISPTIEGLRITGGDAEGLGGGHQWAPDSGGGVYINAARATISDSQVFSNTADAGGGLYLYHSAARLSANTVTTNTASYGGGLNLDSGAAHLDANTITANSAIYGGGLYLRYSDARLTGNIVMANTASSGGGGLCLYKGNPTLAGNTVTANIAEWGGGLYLYDSDATLTGNSVTANIAEQGGGGLCVSGGAPQLSGNTVTANATDRDGGGLYLYDTNTTLINTVVADNQANNAGSGLYIWGASSQLLHTTIARNGSAGLTAGGSTELTTGSGGDGTGVYVTNDKYSTVALTNTILVGHTVGITVTADSTATLEATLWGTDTWANITDWGGTGPIITGTVNYWGDPAFVDPDAGDYHIGWGSAAIDKGVNAGVTSDMDGQPRPMPIGGRFDLGADEHTGIYLSPSRKTASPKQVDVGDVLTYTVVLLNGGSASATNTLLFDAIPTGTTYVSDSAQKTSGVLTDTDGIRWTGTLTPHQAVTITYRVTVNEEARIKNTAIVTDQYGTITTLTAWVNTRRIYLPLVLR